MSSAFSHLALLGHDPKAAKILLELDLSVLVALDSIYVLWRERAMLG